MCSRGGRWLACLFGDVASERTLEEAHAGCLHGLADPSEKTPRYNSSSDDTAPWTYKCDCAADWTDLGYSAATGERQSPVEIVKAQATTVTGLLEVNYQPTSATVVNNGHSVQVNWQPGSVRLDEIDFHLQQ